MKNRTLFRSILALCLLLLATQGLFGYPIDGYKNTGIRRLLRLQSIIDGEIKATAPLNGQQKSINDIRLHLLGERGDSLAILPEPDSALQAGVNALFRGLSRAYSVTVLDITPGKPVRYAKRKEKLGYQPGSVGKLAVIAGLFCELESIYPDSFSKRQALMKRKIIKAGPWAIPNSHTVPFYDIDTKKFAKRILQAKDTFSLYEWADHMVSVSSNGAASVVWREAVLMRVFGQKYPELTQEEADEYFENTERSELQKIAMSVVNEPLQAIGISKEEWHLGSFFTRGAKARIPGVGGSTGSPLGLMKYLVALERGKITDKESSLEIKRLMYITDRRIRYASSKIFTDAAVYFKSGSLYKCKEEEGYECKKYKGNVYNYMNSVAIVEHGDSTTYIVALMSNVLKKNSGSDHRYLASRIEKVIRKEE